MQNENVTNFSIGIEEDIFTSPIQGHQLRYTSDNTPVGSLKPWNEDCILGQGLDYTGQVDYTSSGLECQRWDSNFPHLVRHQPVGSINHNYCRFVLNILFLKNLLFIQDLLLHEANDCMFQNSNFFIALIFTNTVILIFHI